jgi:hypothetical protein
MLRDLIDDLEASIGEHELSLIIADDGSKSRYLEQIRAEYRHLKIQVRQFKVNHGKKKYWMLVSWLFAELRLRKFDFVLMLPDDVRLSPSFFDDLLARWDAIEDPNKICLSPLLAENHYGKPMWGSAPPISIRAENFRIIRTQWTDMCFMAPRKFFELLNFEVRPISPRRWRKKTNLSSGVGEQITMRVRKTGVNMYHLANSLVLHGTHISKMNYEERLRSPLISKRD